MINYSKYFFYFLCIFPSFISNTSIVSINFGANLDAQNAGKDISGIQISNAWYIGHTRGLQPLLSPSNILSHRKSLFKKCPPPPTGKSLKKVLAGIQANSRIRYTKIMFSIHNIKQRLTAGKINVNNLIKGHIHEVFPKRTNLLANLNLLVKLRCINHRISLFQSNTD
jgi:hypothetical protein